MGAWNDMRVSRAAVEGYAVSLGLSEEGTFGVEMLTNATTEAAKSILGVRLLGALPAYASAYASPDAFLDAVAEKAVPGQSGDARSPFASLLPHALAVAWVRTYAWGTRLRAADYRGEWKEQADLDLDQAIVALTGLIPPVLGLITGSASVWGGGALYSTMSTSDRG